MKNKSIRIIVGLLLAGVVSALSTSCNSNNGLSSNNPSIVSTSLRVVDIAAVPIVNNQSASYGIYIKNTSPFKIHGLIFSITNTSEEIAKSTQQSSSLKMPINPTIDDSNCHSIAAGGSCKINITNGNIGNFKITGSIGNTPVVTFVTSIYAKTITRNNNPANALIFSNFPTTLVVVPNTSTGLFSGNYFGAISLFIINTDNAPIDVTNLFSTLPNNVSWNLVSCPNPLPFGGVCQVQLSYNGTIKSNIMVNLHPSGSIGTSALLPQNSTSSFVVTENKIADLNVSYPSLTLNSNMPTINNSITAFITNTGTAAATISSIMINNDPIGIFSISNNQCTGQLAAGSVCQYTITADVSKLSTFASGSYSNNLTVSYSNGTTTTEASGQLNYQYTSLIPTPTPTPTPSVLPNLQLNGIIPSSAYVGVAQTIPLTLTNNSMKSGGGNATLIVNMDSLKTNLGAGLSATLNTDGIGANACSTTTGNISLNQNMSCVVNLELTANIAGSTNVTITPNYQYYTYSTSTNGTLISASGAQIQLLSGTMTTQEQAAALNLSFYSDNSYTTPITNLSVEQGITNPTAVIKVTNSGSATLTSIRLPTVIGFTFTPDTSCNTLGVGLSCNVSVVLNAANIISPALNLNSNLVGYTYTNQLGSQSGSTNLPSLTYQVVAPNAPNINAATSILNCGTGSTTTGAGSWTCNLNPKASGTEAGLASSYQFLITYTNTGSGAAVITVIPASLGNYAAAINNCNKATLVANTGSCTVRYQLTHPEHVGTGDIASSTTLAKYSYTYGSQNQLNGSGGITNPNQINVNVTEPSFSLSVESTSIYATESTLATTTISSWYAGSIPGNVEIKSESQSVIANVSVTCTASGSGCIGTEILTGIESGTTTLASSIIAPDSTTISANTSPSSPLQLTVTPLFTCVADDGNACGCLIQNDGSGLMWYGSTLTNSGNGYAFTDESSVLSKFNGESHCGYTDWRIPTLSSSEDSVYFGSNDIDDTTDFGRLSNYVIINGYASGGNLNSWLNQQGFALTTNCGIYVDCYYFSSSSYTINPNFAWEVGMTNGLVDKTFINYGDFLLPVRGGN